MTSSGMTAMSEPAYLGEKSPFLNFATVKAVIRKDMRTLWPFAAAVAAMSFLMTAFAHEETDFPDFVLKFGNDSSAFHTAPFLFVTSTIILVVGSALFIVMLAQQDRATDPRNDWMARPIKAGELVLAKVLTLTAVVMAPSALGALISVLTGSQDAWLAAAEVYAAAMQCAVFLAIGWLCSGTIQAVLATVGMIIFTVILASLSIGVAELRQPAMAQAVERVQAAPAPPRPVPTIPASPGAASRQVAPVEDVFVIGRTRATEFGGVVRTPTGGVWNWVKFSIAVFAGTLAVVGVTLWLLLGRRQVLAARLTFVTIYAAALVWLGQSTDVVTTVETTPVATLEQRMAAFRKNDANGDLKLNKAEYDRVLTDLGFAGQLDSLWPQRDRNDDGFIDTEEMQPSLGVLTPPATLQQRMTAFTQNDRDKDSKLTKEEYAGALRMLGYSEQLENYWTQRDVDKDGLITLEEYLPSVQ